MTNIAPGKSESPPEVVACLGSSTVASKGTFKWIDELQTRPQNRRFRFVNLGVGGDLAYNALQRLPSVVACRPDRVVILIGGNDVLAAVFQKLRRIYRRRKHLPVEPSAEWFRENVLAIVRRLKADTSARIALASLPQIGEDPNPTGGVQRELNARIAQYRRIIQEIAGEEKVSYIPLYERLHEQILASPGQAFIRFRILSFFRDYLFRRFLLRLDIDQIAQLNGWKFHIDGVHLNTRGGMILAEVVQEFLDS